VVAIELSNSDEEVDEFIKKRQDQITDHLKAQTIAAEVIPAKAKRASKGVAVDKETEKLEKKAARVRNYILCMIMVPIDIYLGKKNAE
jgi:hypothetical protein